MASSERYLIPKGWSRIAISDKTDPWFNFYVSIIFETSQNYIDFDRGLLTFIKRGAREEWQLKEIKEDDDTEIPRGWKIVDINEDNIDKMRPRMGYLLLDAEFDEEKYWSGKLRFLLRESTERTTIEAVEQMTGPRRDKYDHIQCWVDIPFGWEEIEFPSNYLNRFNLNSPILRDFQAGRRKIIQKK